MKKCSCSFYILIFLLLPFIFQAQSYLNMTRIGQWDSGLSYNDCWGYSDDTNEYAILGSLSQVHFLDITNPAEPTLIQEFTPGATSTWRDFKTYGQYAYGCADRGEEGLLIFNLANLPDSVNYLGNLNTHFLRAHNIHIDVPNGRLYVVGSNTRNNGLIIYDIATDPANPDSLASISLPGGYVHDIYVRDNIAYCSHLNQGFYMYDCTIPNSPVTIGQMTTYIGQVFNHSNWLNEAGTHVVFCDEKHGESVKILDITDPTDLQIDSSNLFKSALLAPEVTNSIAHNPFIKDSLAYVAYYHDGIQVFNISNPNNVTRVAYYDTFENTTYSGYNGVWGVYPFLPSGTILVSDRSTGLYLVRMGCEQIEEINTPTVSGTHAVSDNIFTTGNIIVENNTYFRAEQSVELNAGFEVPVSVKFEVTMEGCQ